MIEIYLYLYIIAEKVSAKEKGKEDVSGSEA